MSREATTKLLEMLDDGILDKDLLILACVNYMSEDDVAEMCRLNGYFEHEAEEDETDDETIAERLEYLRGELQAERIGMGELAELQGLAAHIAPDDVELLEPAGVPEFVTRDDIIRLVQTYCADLHESGREWTTEDAEHIAGWLNRDENPGGLFRFIDEKPGDWRVGYKTKDGREWFHILRQMRNKPGSGLLENLRKQDR